MTYFKTAVVVPASAGYPQSQPIVAFHAASSAQQAQRVAREEVCSDVGFSFRRIDELVILMCVRLTKPTRSQIVDFMRGAAGQHHALA